MAHLMLCVGPSDVRRASARMLLRFRVFRAHWRRVKNASALFPLVIVPGCMSFADSNGLAGYRGQDGSVAMTRGQVRDSSIWDVISGLRTPRLGGQPRRTKEGSGGHSASSQTG